jgi:hypothetical protein
MPARRQSLVQDVETSFRPPGPDRCVRFKHALVLRRENATADEIALQCIFEVAAVNIAISQFKEPVRDGLGVTSLFWISTIGQ